MLSPFVSNAFLKKFDSNLIQKLLNTTFSDFSGKIRQKTRNLILFN